MTGISYPTQVRRRHRLALFVILTVVCGTAFYSASSAHLKDGTTSGPKSPSVHEPSLIDNNAFVEQMRLSNRGSNAFRNLALWPQDPSEPEQIETFDSDCMTPKTSFNFGDVVCAKVSGGPPLSISPRKIAWVDTDNNILQRVDVLTDTQTDLFTIPTVSTSTDYRGVWRVNDISASRAAVRTSAFFIVSNPAQRAADLLIYNGNDSDGSVTAGSNVEFVLWLSNKGPDTASMVQVTDTTPINTSFLSGQVSDPAWSCTFPAANSSGGTTICTLASLAPGGTAKIDLVYNVNSGTPVNTAIANIAHISSDTVDPRDDSNTPPPQDPNGDPSNNTATSRVVVIAGSPQDTCTLDCPDNITANANTTENNQRGAHVVFDTPTAAGSCGTITTTPSSGSFFPVGTTVVSVTSTEGDGDCSFTVTVEDHGTNPASISCPANQQVNANNNCEASVTLGDPSTTGDNVTVVGSRSDGRSMYNCDSDGNNCVRRVPDSPFSAGVTTITWTAYSHDVPGPFSTPDEEEAHRNGSASCTQTITVNDVEPPTIVVTPQTSAADATCQAAVPDFSTTATVTDNCGCSSSDDQDNCSGRQPITMTQDPAPGTIVGLGAHTITLSANDGSSNNNGAGNTTTTTTTFTVIDATAPILTCPTNITTANQPGTCSAIVNVGTPIVTDNCDGNPTVTGVRSDGLALNVPYQKGTTTITWTATDSAGNSTSCTQTILVTDVEPPTITLTGENPQYVECHTSYVDRGATATDNCDGSFAATPSGSVDVNSPGTYTINYNASDTSGNHAMQVSRTVIVRDTLAPTITLNNYAPSMWPPNHRYTTFQLTQFVTGASDSCSTNLGLANVVIETVTSDEIENGNGDGNTLNDIIIAANCKSVQLRSEREGAGNGRVYTITFKVTDGSGNVGRATARVVVPHNPGETAIDSGIQYTVNGNCP